MLNIMHFCHKIIDHFDIASIAWNFQHNLDSYDVAFKPDPSTKILYKIDFTSNLFSCFRTQFIQNKTTDEFTMVKLLIDNM